MGAIKTPHAAIIVWNYIDRITSTNTSASNVHRVEPKIFSTLTCRSIRTSKSKSQPEGSFELVLAPRRNWTATLTPGSWLAILMSQDKITNNDMLTKANPNKVKMLGRIHSVRSHVVVDQTTGARMTEYIISGSDWGHLLNTLVYVDPMVRDASSTSANFWVTWRLLYEKLAISLVENKKLPSSDDNVKTLIGLWGQDPQAVQEMEAKIAGTGNAVKVASSTAYQLPKEVGEYFGFETNEISKLLTLKSGVVQDGNKKSADNNMFYDQYPTEDAVEAVGVINPDSIFGTHTLWQLLRDNCNDAINELVADMRWEQDGKAKLTLYKRVRPFIFRDDFDGKTAKLTEPLIAYMYNVRTVKIPLNDILAADAGTNWQDKYNFVEILVDQSNTEQVRNYMIKGKSQSLDEVAFPREGFRPMFVSTRYLPKDMGGGFDPFGVVDWKNLIREWHFNSHVLLNGNIVFMGQNNYIQVGDNIMFDERAITTTQNINADSLKHRKDSPHVLAHVESVSHNFTVDNKGARHFSTTVSFVRGIIVDNNRRPIKDISGLGEQTEGRLDKDATSLSISDDLNKKNVFGSSTQNDPDPDRRDGD
jgi:hypothetical protein